jgi:diguanylate cyclase (GGDEF)-like protein
MNRLYALQIGTTLPEPIPVSRALIAAFWTIVATMIILSLPLATANGSEFTAEAQKASLIFLSAVALLTAMPALLLRSGIRQTETRRRMLLDPLTRLPGRQLLRLDLAAAIAKAARTQALVSVITLDVGGLTAVAERLGDTARDQLLIDIGRRLKRAVRAKDTVARSGEEEFTILLASSPRADDVTWATERAIEELDAPFSIGREEVLLTATAGIGLNTQADCPVELLIRTAGVALTRARSAGRTRYGVLYADMVAPAA